MFPLSATVIMDLVVVTKAKRGPRQNQRHERQGQLTSTAAVLTAVVFLTAHFSPLLPRDRFDVIQPRLETCSHPGMLSALGLPFYSSDQIGF